jgi:hypothetical protein
MHALAFYDQARQALAQAAQIDEVKDIRDKAEALRLYTRQANEGLQLQNWCAEIKIRAERRIGQLLTDNPEYGRGKKTLTQRDLGIDHNQASRWQRMATLDASVFERYVAATKAAGQELTSAAVYREAHKRAVVKVTRAIPRSPPADPIDAQGRTPYVKWANGAQQIANWLQEINGLGGFEAIIKRLTPAQTEEVIAEVHRLHQQIQVLVGDVARVGPVITISRTSH